MKCLQYEESVTSEIIEMENPQGKNDKSAFFHVSLNALFLCPFTSYTIFVEFRFPHEMHATALGTVVKSLVYFNGGFRSVVSFTHPHPNPSALLRNPPEGNAPSHVCLSAQRTAPSRRILVSRRGRTGGRQLWTRRVSRYQHIPLPLLGLGTRGREGGVGVGVRSGRGGEAEGERSVFSLSSVG